MGVLLMYNTQTSYKYSDIQEHTEISDEHLKYEPRAMNGKSPLGDLRS